MILYSGKTIRKNRGFFQSSKIINKNSTLHDTLTCLNWLSKSFQSCWTVIQKYLNENDVRLLAELYFYPYIFPSTLTNHNRVSTESHWAEKTFKQKHYF